MDISAIIISFNSEKFLEHNLVSLVNQSFPFRKIIVVDNHSRDNSVKIIEHFKTKGPIELIALQKNIGYAAAANLAIKKIESDILLVANADIILDEKFNSSIIEKFRIEKDIAIISPLILRFDRKTVDSAGQDCSYSLFPTEIGYNKRIEEVNIEEKAVFSVCGAATVFSHQALEQLKLNEEYYDEDFFIFWEDFDLGWRAQLLKLKTLFFPTAIVYHYRSGTLKKNFLAKFSLALARPANIKYHLVKNRYLSLIKNFRFGRNYLSIPFIILKDFIWVGLLTFSSPKIIIPMMKSGKYILSALQKRRQLKVKELCISEAMFKLSQDPNE